MRETRESRDGVIYNNAQSPASKRVSLVMPSLPFVASFFLCFFQQPVVAVPLVPSVNRRKEEELSVGSAPLAKQQSYQASEYASSPIKTKTVTGMCQEQMYQFSED